MGARRCDSQPAQAGGHIGRLDKAPTHPTAHASAGRPKTARQEETPAEEKGDQKRLGAQDDRRIAGRGGQSAEHQPAGKGGSDHRRP
eukprot:scaffold111767_cov23-Prasinocladus_malaysianus.AAC.1